MNFKGFHVNGGVAPNLHPDPYFSKVTPFPRKFPQDGRQALTYHRRDRTGAGRKRQGGMGDVGDAHPFGERPGEVPAHCSSQLGLGPSPQVPRSDGGIGGKDPGQRLRGGGLGHGRSGESGGQMSLECDGQAGGGQAHGARSNRRRVRD